MRASATGLVSAFAAVSPTEGGNVACAITPTRTEPSPRPSRIPMKRWPRMVSTSESEASTPTSMSTNRKSIITAPV
ncbi:hypothetical protein D3C74_386750 [compost metagenome]